MKNIVRKLKLIKALESKGLSLKLTGFFEAPQLSEYLSRMEVCELPLRNYDLILQKELILNKCFARYLKAFIESETPFDELPYMVVF